MKRLTVRAGLMAALAWSVASTAQDAQIAQLRSMSLTEMLQVDISTGTSKLIYQAPGVAYVITADDIARMGARNMQEVLESIPGLHVYLYQGVVNSPLVDLRGLLSERGGYVLFLRDGRPLRLISNNTMPEIFRLPVQFIERIEVVRGPVSAVYGSDALAGAVNVITRVQPEGVGLRVGENDARAGWAGIFGNAGPIEWSGAVSRSHNVDDFVTRSRIRNSIYTQQIGQEYTDIDVKLRSDGFKADFWALNYHKEETGNPANPRGLTDVRTQNRHAALGYAQKLSPTTDFDLDVFYTYFRGTRIAEILQGVPTNGDNGEERTTARFTMTESRFAGHRLRLNAGYVQERNGNYLPPPPAPPPGQPAPVLPPNSRKVQFLSVQDEFAFWQDWELTAGMRLDRYEDIGRVNTPRVGLVWSVSPRLTAKLLQSKGFRAPGLSANNNSTTPLEEVSNTELAFDYRPNERWRAVFNAYRYHGLNLIISGAPGAPVIERNGRGGEVELSWLVSPSLKFESTISILSAHDVTTGARVPYTPKTSAKFAVNYRTADSWSMHLRWEGYWDRIRPVADRRPPLDDFQLVNATLRRDISRNISALFTVHNLFNKRTYLPVLSGANSDDYQLPERNVSLQLEVHF